MPSGTFLRYVFMPRLYSDDEEAQEQQICEDNSDNIECVSSKKGTLQSF